MWTEARRTYSRLVPPNLSHMICHALSLSTAPGGRMFGSQALKMLDESCFTDQEHIFSILCEQEIYFSSVWTITYFEVYL